MNEQTILKHHIQKHIVEVLKYQKYARFRDMRPPKVDTNLYSYHLKLLQKSNFVEKTQAGYTLGKHGLVYVDRYNTNLLKLRTNPRIINMFVIQNADGDVLLSKRQRQPHLDLWTLPTGKVYIKDKTILGAAEREISQKLQLTGVSPRHAGDCYLRIVDGDDVTMSTLAHVFYFETDDASESQTLKWARPHKLSQYDLAPAVEKIVARTFFKDPYFFEEYAVEW